MAPPTFAFGLMPLPASILSDHAVAIAAGYLAAALAITLIVLLTRAYRRTVATLRASEQALTRRLRLEDVITRASTRFINVDLAQVDEEIDRALGELGEFAGADRAYVFHFREDEEIMDNTHEWCREGVSAEMQQLQNKPFSAFPWFTETMLRREVALYPRVRDLPPEARLEREEFARESIESIICVPMVLEDRAVGFIGFDSVTAEDAWSEEAITLLRVAANAISGALARRRGEEALRASEERYRGLVEVTSDWIWEVDANGVYTYASPKVRELLGYEPSEVLGRTPFDLMPPEEAKRVAEAVGPYFERCEPFVHLENLNLHKDGHEVVLDTSGVPVRDAVGKLCGFRGIDRDITEQRRAQEALRESEARYRQFLQISAEGIWRLEVAPPIPTDLEEREQAELMLQRARVVECNEVFARRNRVSRPEDMIGLCLDELWQEGHEAKVAALVQSIRSGYRVTDLESNAPLPDGTQGHFLDNFIGLVEGGFLVGAWGTERDITGRRRAEEALRESEARLRALFAAMTDVILIMDVQGRYLEIVPTKPDLLYRPAEELLGRTVTEVFPAEQAEFFLDHIRQALETKEPVPMAYTLRIGERDLRFAAEVSPLSEDSVIVVARDITVQTEQYEQWLAAERARVSLAEHLNEEINHRARNNLAMVSGLLQMQALQTADADLASKLREAVARIRTFVDIHEKIYAVGAEEVDLLEVLQQVASTLGSLFSGLGAEVSVEGVPTPCPTRAATNLAVVTNELITNALKHGRPEPEGARRIVARVARTEGRLELSVWNSGNPVPEGFDATAQTGMGLRLACDLVAQYGGTCALRPVAGGTLAELVIAESALRE